MKLDIFKVINKFEDCGFIEELEEDNENIETCLMVSSIESSSFDDEFNPQPSMADLPSSEEVNDFVHSQPLPLVESSASSLPSIINPPSLNGNHCLRI